MFVKSGLPIDATLPALREALASGSSAVLQAPPGAGKSTAMNLLQRLWDPVSGSIRIDGQDLRDVTLESLRRSIGVVFQVSIA